MSPTPELEKRTRRGFSTEYKLKILAEAERCAHGELGVLLRREKLYSAQLQQWRNAQPTLGVLIKLAQTLHVSLDEMVFEEGERGPDEDLRLQFEAISRVSDEDKRIIKALLDGMIIKHKTQQRVSNLSG